MELGIKDITFYVQNHIAPRAVCYNFPLIRDKPLVVPAFVKLFYLTGTKPMNFEQGLGSDDYTLLSISDMHRHAENHINRDLIYNVVLPVPLAGDELTTYEGPVTQRFTA